MLRNGGKNAGVPSAVCLCQRPRNGGWGWYLYIICERVWVCGCVNMYVCVCVCIVWMYVCVCILYVLYACMYVCMYVCVYTNIHTNPQTGISKQAHTTHTRNVHSLLKQNAAHRTLICSHFSPLVKTASKPRTKSASTKTRSSRGRSPGDIGVQSLNRALTEP